MGISIWLIWKNKPSKTRTLGIRIFWLQLFFFEAIIESKARLTYEETSNFFEKEDYPLHLSTCLTPLKKIYDLLKEQKISRCALELEIPDYLPKIRNGNSKLMQTFRDFKLYSLGGGM